MMKLSINGKIISSHCNEAKGLFGKALGLMFRKKVSNPLIFSFAKAQYVPLHMWFVFTAIDVIFVNNNTIVEIKENFKPWHFYSPKKKAECVIEFAAGTISQHAISVGQKVSIFRSD